jgi:Rap guanine nucleotide exchange factor 1
MTSLFRSALAEACPPCIPYIGLVLQDLTFVHIGNPDTIEDRINFAKRWQQFNILVSVNVIWASARAGSNSYET